jgi:hypothetical protein
MTATSTAELEAMLATRKAALTAPEPIAATEAEVVADVVTGEIVPASDREVAPPVIPAPAPEYVIQYPEKPPKVVGGLPYVRDYMKLAKTIHSTEMVPKPLQGDPDKILAVFMAGYELGLGPMQSLNSFDMIEGRPALKPEAMRALIMDKGHLFVLSEGEDYAEVTARRKDWPEDMSTTYRYSLEDARLAALLHKRNWEKMPRAMLAARATGGAARNWFADVIAGMSYTTEEVQDFAGKGEAPTWQTPPAASTSPSTIPTEPPPAAVEQPTPETSPSSEPPKRPRGRPRKDAKPPAEAPVLELTSLNAPEPEPPALEPSPGEGGVLIQTRQALSAIIKGLPTAQQPACRAFISQHFPGLAAIDLTGDELQKCIDIAAGWPDSAAQHPLPNEDDPESFPYSDADG